LLCRLAMVTGRAARSEGVAQTADAAAEQGSAVAQLAADAPRLWRLFRRRTRCPEAADDLLQESFARVAGAGSAAPLRNPGGYFTRIAQNLLRDRAKRAARRAEDVHVPFDAEMVAGTDPIRMLEARDMLDRIELAMLELSPATREIFMAHRIDGLTYAEIAGRTGLTVKQVEKAIARAMLHIDRALGPD